RMIGLYAFAYACLHLSAYLVLDLRGYWTQIFEEIAKRPYITVGFSAWLLLLPLAITSTKGWIRRLGRNWGRLHKLVYAAGVLAVLHFWWLVQSDIREPALYAASLALLLGWRAWTWTSKRRASARAGAALRQPRTAPGAEPRRPATPGHPLPNNSNNDNNPAITSAASNSRGSRQGEAGRSGSTSPPPTTSTTRSPSSRTWSPGLRPRNGAS